MKISNQVLSEITKQVEDHLINYQPDLEEAYAKSAEALAISFNVKVSPNKGSLKIETGISFVKDKLSDKSTVYVDDNQGELFGDEK